MAGGNFNSFMWGALLGLGAGLFLNSEQGKKWRKAQLEDVNDFESRIEKKVEEAMKAAKNKVNEAATKVKEATEN